MSDSTIHATPDRAGLFVSLGTFFGLGTSYIALCHHWSKVGLLGQDSDSQTQLALFLMLSMLLSLTGLVGAVISMQRVKRSAKQCKNALWGLALAVVCAVPPLWFFCQPI